MYNQLDLIKAHIHDYGLTRMVCPWCNGGASGEESMTTYLADNGYTVLATCHRAQCSIGTIAVDGRTLSTKLIKEDRVKTSTAADRYRTIMDDWPTYKRVQWSYHPRLHCLNSHLMEKYVREAPAFEARQVYIRQMDEENNVRGVVVRNLEPKGDGPKSFTFSDTGYHGMGFFNQDGVYPVEVDPLMLVAVEDSLSAMAIAGRGYDAVSLNGTHINDERLRAMGHAHNRIILCLDADATRDAIRTAHKFSGVGSLEVRRLTKDFKDMTHTERRDFAERYLT